MSFERFTDVGARYKPTVSITKGGMISFNQGALKRFDLGKYKFVILYFDRENQLVGVQPTNDPLEEGVCKLRHRQSGADVSAKSFLDFYGIQYGPKAIRFNPKWKEEYQMIIFSPSQRKVDRTGDRLPRRKGE